MYRFKITGTDQASFGSVPVLKVVIIMWSTVTGNPLKYEMDNFILIVSLCMGQNQINFTFRETCHHE